MKFTLKDYLEIAVIVALTVVLGLFFYLIGRMLLLPGSKILTQSVFLGVMLSCILQRVRKMGALSLTCFVFGGIMSFVMLVMGAVILLSAILSESLVFVLFRSYHPRSIKIATGLYTLFAFLLTFFSSVYITGSEFAIGLENHLLVIAAAAAAFLLGMLGGALGLRLMSRGVFQRTTAEQ